MNITHTGGQHRVKEDHATKISYGLEMKENNSQKDEVDGFGLATNTVNPIVSGNVALASRYIEQRMTLEVPERSIELNPKYRNSERDNLMFLK